MNYSPAQLLAMPDSDQMIVAGCVYRFYVSVGGQSRSRCASLIKIMAKICEELYTMARNKFQGRIKSIFSDIKCVNKYIKKLRQ